MVRAVVVLILTLGASSAWACAKEDNAKCQIEKKAWVELMAAMMPAVMCKEGSAFRQCLEVTQTSCIDATLTLTQSCLQDLNIPERFEKSDSPKWGGMLGACVGGKLSSKFPLKAGKRADCIDATASQVAK